jgi:tripartite-type tricarboxylate transporter receptor subunit TctC
MRIVIQTIRATAALLLALTALGAPAQAEYPEQPIKLIMPYPAGGMTDVSGRSVMAELARKLGGTIVVENKPGAASTVASNWMSQQKPDGYTLYAAPVSLVLNPLLQGKVGYGPYDSFVPISMMIESPFVLQVNKDLPVNSVQELVALIRKQPDRYAIGTSGVGSINHLAAEYFMSRFGLKLTVVHYKGGGPASQDLVGNQIQMMFSAANEAEPLIKAGRTRALAVTTTRRLPLLPDTPTMNEAAGLDDFEAVFWLALMAPKGLPADIAQRLSTAMQQLGQDPALAQRMQALGVSLQVTDGQEVVRRMRQDEAKWGALIKRMDLKPEN